jgi:ABC-type phosphate/phosphonate transport system substrate-binding protein
MASRLVRALVALSLALPSLGALAQRQDDWVFGINEGALTEQNSILMTEKYQAFADYLGKHLKGKRIKAVPTVDIQRFEKYLADGRYALVFGKSVNVLAKAVRDQRYQPLAKREDAYKAVFIVPKDSTLKTLAELKGEKVLLPDERTYTSQLGLATMREAGLNPAQLSLQHTRFQEAVAEYVRLSGAAVGLVNPTAGKRWVESGGRILAETKGFVNWSVLAAPDMRGTDVQQLTEILTQMKDSAEGRELLKSLGVPAFVKADKQDYLALMKFIDG